MKVLAVLGAALASVLLACALYATDKAQPKNAAAGSATAPAKPTLPKGSPAEQVAALTKQHEQAMNAFRKLYDAAKTEEEQEKLLDVAYPEPNPYAALLVQIAEQNPKDPAAVEALIWAVRNGTSAPGSADSPFSKAKGLLVRDYLKNPKVGPLCRVLSRQFWDTDALEIIRRVLADNPGKEAQAQAAFALAKMLRDRAVWPRTLPKAEPKQLANLEKSFGKNNLDALRRGDAGALEKEAEDLLERITKDKTYADTAIQYGEAQVKLGELAGRELFEMRHLQPGKLAPEIAGEDIDGKPMKLSDFRGRVVLLEFWGHW